MTANFPSSSSDSGSLLKCIEELSSHQQHQLRWMQEGHDIPAGDIFELVGKLRQKLPDDSDIHKEFLRIRALMKKEFDKSISEIQFLTGSIKDRIEDECAFTHKNELKQLLEKILGMVKIEDLQLCATKLRGAGYIDDTIERRIMENIAEMRGATKEQASEILPKRRTKSGMHSSKKRPSP